MLYDELEPYKDLDIPEDEIQKIIQIFQSFSDNQKRIILFYLEGFNATQLSTMFGQDNLYVMDLLNQSLTAFNSLDLLNVKKILRIHIRSDEYDSLPLFPNTNDNESFFQWKWKRIKLFVWKFHPIERVILAICALAFLYGGMSTGRALYKIGLVQIERKESADTYTNPTEDAPRREAVETVYLPEYLPDGYELSQQDGYINKSSFIDTVYVNNDYEILLRQNVNEIVIDLDNEDISTKNIFVNGNEGIYQEGEYVKKLIWSDNNYFYLLHITDSNITEQEFLKVANSIGAYE